MILNEALLLAEPESEYMSAAQIAFFKALLLDKHTELGLRIREHELAISVSEPVSDVSDAGSQEEGRSLMTRILQTERGELAAIKAALAGIGEDTYGYCLDTGEPIGLRRLLLRPTALRTAEAQSRHERLGQHMRAAAV